MGNKRSSKHNLSVAENLIRRNITDSMIAVRGNPGSAFLRMIIIRNSRNVKIRFNPDGIILFHLSDDGIITYSADITHPFTERVQDTFPVLSFHQSRKAVIVLTFE